MNIANWTILDRKGPVWSVACHCGYRTTFAAALMTRPPKCKRCGSTSPVQKPVDKQANQRTPELLLPFFGMAPVEPKPEPVKPKPKREPQTQRLTILGPAPKDGKGARVYAKCTCGTVKSYAKTKIVTGATKSCGCYKAEILRAAPPALRELVQALPGMVYTWLTVLREAQPYYRKDKRERRVVCRCQCGSARTYLVRSLTHGDSKSCGCLRRKSERGRWEPAAKTLTPPPTVSN